MPLELAIQNSRHLNALVKIVNAYQGQPLLAALVTYVHGVELKASSKAKEELSSQLAEQVCERLHEPPAVGVKCLRCYDVEMGLLNPEPEEVVAVEPLPEEES